MIEIHAFDPDGTPSPGAQAALEHATDPLATRAEVEGAVEGLASQDDVAGLASRDELNTAVAGLASTAYVDDSIQGVVLDATPGVSPSEVRSALGFRVLVGGEQPETSAGVPVLWADTGGARVDNPTAPPRGWPIASDTFSRIDGPLGLTSWGHKPWVSPGDAFGIASGRAKFVSGTGNGFAVIDAGALDVEVTAQLGTPPIDGTVVGLMARYSGPTNQLVVQTRATVSKTSYALWERVDGAITMLADSEVTPVIGDNFGLRVVGTSVELVVNGKTVATGTATLAAGTSVGLYGHSNDQVSAFENITVKGV